MTKIMWTATAAAALLAASTAQASTVVVTPTAMDGWTNPAGDNTGGGHSDITGAVARNGNGSLEMFGDRTRFVRPTWVALADVLSLTYDWRVAGNSVSNLDPDLTPALRLNIIDGAQGSSLIWEGAYNGLYGTVNADTWYSTTSSSTFYKRLSGGPGGTENVERTISAWLSAYSANAFVSSISVGVGSSAGAGYHAFADNVTLATTGGSTTWNFEANGGAVPEPASWALMLMGFASLGAMLRRARRGGAFATA